MGIFAGRGPRQPEMAGSVPRNDTLIGENMKSRIVGNPAVLADALSKFPDEEVRVIHKLMWAKMLDTPVDDTKALVLGWLDRLDVSEEEGGGHVRPAAVTELDALPDDPGEKAAFIHTLGKTCTDKLVGVSFFSQAWMSHKDTVFPRKEALNLRPSQDPARQHGLIAVTMTKDGRIIQTIAEVHEQDGKWVPIDIIESEDVSSAPILERFWAGYIEGEMERLKQEFMEKLGTLSAEQKRLVLDAVNEGRFDKVSSLLGLENSDNVWVIPDEFTTDAEHFDWGNSLHRVWHVRKDDKWYNAVGERNAAGAVHCSAFTIELDVVEKEITEHGLRKVGR